MPASSDHLFQHKNLSWIATRELNLGDIPFNCNFNYDLPENVKIACKARFISRTLGFSIYAFPLILLLLLVLQVFFKVIKRIFNNLQRNLLVL